MAQTAIESFYKQGSERNEPLLDLAKKAITLRKIRGEFHIKQSDDISIRGKFFPDERTLFIVYSESSKVQTSIYVQPFLREKLFIEQLETISESPMNDLSFSFIQKLLLNTEKSKSVRLHGSNVGTEESARKYGFEGNTLENGLELTRDPEQLAGYASEHTISMNAFFRA